jgi:hypothetical protein
MIPGKCGDYAIGKTGNLRIGRNAELAGSGHKSHDGLRNSLRCFSLRKVADPWENDPLIRPGKVLFFAVRSGGVVTRVAGAMDHQSRNRNDRAGRKLRFNNLIRRIFRSQTPAYAIGVENLYITRNRSMTTLHWN